MSMMDLQAALGGGPPQPGGPGLNPEALMGAPVPEDAMGGEPVPGEEPPEGGGSSLDHLLDAEAALQEFIAVDPDDADRAKASQALKIILDLKAANTQDARDGGMKSLSRALSGA
jgi:hypothetical protein